MNELHSALLASGDKQALVDALAMAAGITLLPASKAVVTAHLVVAAEMAQLLFAAPPLPTGAEPAPVFRLPACPVSHGDSQ